MTKQLVGKYDRPVQVPPAPEQNGIAAQTFEVTDSLGNHLGWGYDVYVNGKKTLHQPIIPQMSGNNYFKSETDARKVGDLVAARMRVLGSFYSVTAHDLDSLGIVP